MYATSKELKKKAFTKNSQNIQQAVDIQLTFISEIKLQKEHFLAKYDCSFGDLCVYFEPLFGWECAKRMSRLQS